mgnify:CR=1 FL=1
MTWQVRPVGEVFRVVNGGTPKTGVAKYWGGPHQWITPAEMGSLPTPYLAKSRRTLTDAGLQAAELVPANSIILSSRAPIGHLVINEAPMAFNQGCKGLVPAVGIDGKFAYYFFLANVPLLESLGTGATFKELSGGKLRDVAFCFPVLKEQNRIVAILDEAFAGISTAKANAEKSLHSAQAVFTRALDTAFLNRSWYETTLEALLKEQPRNGWSPPAANHAEAGTPVLTLSSVTGFCFHPERTKFTSAETVADRHYWVCDGDLLITRSNTPELVGHVAIAFGINTPTIYPDLIMRMRVDSGKASTDFLYYQLRSTKLRNEIRRRAHGASSTMKKIDKSGVQTLPIRVASLDEQRRVASRLHEIEVECEHLESLYSRKLAALDELKQSLLQQAFAGQL